MKNVTILVGGQYGSEGKGKIAGYLAKKFDWGIRSGGPNSGHVVYKGEQQYKLRMIPSSFVNLDCKLALCTASMLNVKMLLKEIEVTGINKKNLLIDEYAAIIDDSFIDSEKTLGRTIGSTSQGVGATLIERIKRDGNLKFAKDMEALKPYIGNVSDTIQNNIKLQKKVLIEGHQGFALSLYRGEYPFVTSRDTTSATLCGEVGIGFNQVEDVILIIRAYPIRSGFGPFPNEIDWDEVTESAHSDNNIIEYTTVTNRKRRVARFDIESVKKALVLNSATKIALNFVDYINASDYGISQYKNLSIETKKMIEWIENETSTPVSLIGTGPFEHQIVDRIN